MVTMPEAGRRQRESALAAQHDSDFYAWTREQAATLRRAAGYRLSDIPGLDWLNLAEEIESLGISLERELFSRYRILLMHLLKWQFEAERRGKSWQRTIENQRDDIALLLRKNPSLRRKRAGELAEAYPRARKDAAHETGLPLDTFPADCPFTLDEVEDERFWPEAAVAGARG
jgi:hypothetical protein